MPNRPLAISFHSRCCISALLFTSVDMAGLLI
jgi:hypothetical protein